MKACLLKEKFIHKIFVSYCFRTNFILVQIYPKLILLLWICLVGSDVEDAVVEEAVTVDVVVVGDVVVVVVGSVVVDVVLSVVAVVVVAGVVVDVLLEAAVVVLVDVFSSAPGQVCGQKP